VQLITRINHFVSKLKIRIDGFWSRWWIDGWMINYLIQWTDWLILWSTVKINEHIPDKTRLFPTLRPRYKVWLFSRLHLAPLDKYCKSFLWQGTTASVPTNACFIRNKASTVKMEAARSTETLISCHTTWRNNPENHKLHLHRREYLKSCNKVSTDVFVSSENIRRNTLYNSVWMYLHSHSTKRFGQ